LYATSNAKLPMTWLAYFIVFFTSLRLLVALSNFFLRRWLRKGLLLNEPMVSVLIPARNEEKNIGRIVNDLINHDYNNLEIIVYDDLSEDNTYQIVHQFAIKHDNVKAIKGEFLPEGWLGKNHACHRLALQAEGDYLLFLDADVIIKKGLVKNALAHLRKYQLSLLSIFPVQIMKSFSERLAVPLMNWILVSLLPLIFTRISSWPSFSAANGQFMLFDAGVYHKETFHKVLKSHKVEDIAIFRLMKKKGYKVETLLGNNSIRCRMYQTWDEAVKGFSKNVFEFFGGSRVLAYLFGLLTTFGFLVVLLALPLIFTLLYFLMVILLRIIISLASRQNVFLNLLLAPLQQINFLIIMAIALVLQNKKATLWKGRNIDVETKI